MHNSYKQERRNSMEISHIKYFKAAADTQNLSKAAELLNITQPALSKAIKQIEFELGAALFERSGKKVILNSNGIYFLENITPILSALESTFFDLKVVSNELVGTINIKISSASPVIIELISNFRAKYPRIGFNIFQHDSNFDDNTFDVIISELNYSGESFDSKFLFKEEIKLGIPMKHPLFTKKQIFIEDIINYPFIMTTHHIPIRTTIDNYLKSHNIQLKIALTSDDASTVRSLANKTNALAFIPTHTWLMSNLNSIRIVSIEDLEMFREIFFNYHRHNVSPYIEYFNNYIINNFKKLT